MKRWLGLWLTCVLVGSAAAQTVAGDLVPKVTPPPGVYPAPLVLDVAVPQGATTRYRYLESASTQTFAWAGPVSLDALAGERRAYTLRLTTVAASGEAVTRDYRYVVARAAEPQPTVQPAPGVFTSAVVLKPILPPGWSLALDGKAVDEVPVLDTEPGARVTFAVDASGPAGAALRWVYTVDRRDQEAAALEVLSPVPGAWDNAQALVAAFQGVDRVVWSYGTTVDKAQPYEGPLLLDRPGSQTVTVAARSRADGTWLQKTVSWTNGQAPSPAPGWPLSGVQLGGLDLPQAAGWSLSWDDGRSWQPSQAVHREASSSVSRKVLAVLARQGAAVQRYLWWLDARAPAAPDLQFVGGWNPQLVVSGSNEALYRATWTFADGKTRDEPLALWGPVGLWKVPDGVVGARVSVQGFNGAAGSPASLGFAETGWSTPSWEPWDNRGPQTDTGTLPLGGRVPPRPGFRAAYEVSDRPDVPEPSAQSPWLSSAFLPAVPWGADRTFYVRFAWRDDSGLVGPASRPVAVRVDRVPPFAPEVREVGGQVLVKPPEGEEEGTDLFWAVSASRVDSPSSLTFQPYRGGLSVEALRAGSAQRLWFHAQAQDRAGNLGPVRLNLALAPAAADNAASLVQVDPDPSVGESPVEDGGVYPWPQFRLRALEPGKDLWVGVSDPKSGVPADWKSGVQPWPGVLSRAVGRGERRTFVIYWNAKTAEGWAWPQPKTVSLTLDQGPPAPPELTGVWPSGPVQSWTLSLKPGRSGDSLRYTFTTDGSAPADPASGEIWPGTRTWTVAPGSRAEVRLRVAAVSAAGLAVEMAPLSPVVVDRVTPEPVVPNLEPFSYRAGAFTVPAPAGAGTVRYTLTNNGSLPEVPSPDSPSLGAAGLELLGAPGQSVLYRFRWRPYSPSGLPGPVSEAYSVLIDRTAAPLVPSPVSTDPERAVVIPHLTGLPATGISSSPVTLRAEAAPGLLRYEVGEGVSLSRPVTALSPAWTGSLVLDGGPGVDREYTVSLRGFSPDGRPLTDEVRSSVRVDRSFPAAPSMALITDPRRPEAVLTLTPDRPNPEETLYYRWFWESFPQGKGESAWQAAADENPRFSAPDGALTRLRVQSYFRDEAGNDGPVAEGSVLIDQNVVYVAPKGDGDGTRLHPLGAVAEAVEGAHRSGKTVVLLAAGAFGLSRTVDLGGLSVYGGLNAELWESAPAAGRSLWTASPGFAGASLLESGDQPWLLSRVDLSTGSAALDRAVVVRGAAVTVQASAWTWSGAGGGWDQSGGTLDWSDVAVTYTASPRSTFLDLKSVRASVRGLTLAASQNSDGLLFELNDSQGLFQDLAVVSKRASGFDGVWQATASRLTINNARLLAGDGAQRSSAFVLKDTEAVLFNTDVSLFGSSSNTGYQTTGGRLELQKATLNLLRGDEFNQAVSADQSEVVVRTFQFKVGTGAYQGGFSVSGGSLALSSGTVQLAGAGQRVWGAQFLSPSLVNFDDVSWLLAVRTPGDLWKIDKPWKEGSGVTGSKAQGW
jgi:hypothetical protein